MDIIDKNVLGHVSLIEAATNRNDDVGAWQYAIHPDANPQTSTGINSWAPPRKFRSTQSTFSAGGSGGITERACPATY
jgi:hypothetical protein